MKTCVNPALLAESNPRGSGLRLPKYSRSGVTPTKSVTMDTQIYILLKGVVIRPVNLCIPYVCEFIHQLPFAVDLT